MRIKTFKLFESRTSELSKSEFKKILHENCKEFVKNPKLLQRSKDIKYTEIKEISYMNPKLHNRNPLMNSDNFHDGVSSKHCILLMDNLPSWNKFPKRNQSIIGCTDVDPRSIFGHHKFLIIPFDNAKFGVAPSSDVWSCSIIIENNKYYFNDDLSKSMSNSGISDDSYFKMIEDLQKRFENHNLENKNHLEVLFNIAKNENYSNIEEFLNDIFNPSKFKGTDIDDLEGFQLLNYNSLLKIDSLYEFWTDSECLIYYIGKSSNEDFISNKYEEFLMDYINI